jgi:PAS domain S-box-containing protein
LIRSSGKRTRLGFDRSDRSADNLKTEMKKWDSPGQWIARNRDWTLLRYGGAAVAVWIAVCVSTIIPLVHRHPFAMLLAAVLFTAHYLGFGPAILCSLLSAVSLHFFTVPPASIFGLGSGTDIERLIVFLAISIFASSLARQKTLAESRAERMTNEMAAIVESSRDAILTVDPEGVITSWNRAAEQLFGYTAEEAVGMPVANLVPRERTLELLRNRRILNEGGTIEPYKTERLRKDGKCQPVLLSISPLFNSRGEIVGSSGIVRDIAFEKQSEEAVLRSEKLATAGRMAASIAHEINNPLEAVLNLLYLARQDATHSDEYLTMAEQEVGRVARLAQQTLGLVRESNTPDSVDPANIMEETLELYTRKLASRQIRVSRRYRANVPIQGYAGELRQLFANLIVNAADAIGEGGSLHVRVVAGHDWSNGREGIRITVADSGAGIPRENLERIFEPFYTTKKGRGTGLGLWVSSGIVRKHGGAIRVRSRSNGNGAGTIFSIFLPYQYVAAEAA